ncbi:methyl-accepting chemotaxis protein [Kurthia senegalensis]|uniref:methyl-accepting chemotaxis protein n=1 Tax=Kurthia senegalensis TaxID=1033740 RepID=UPI0002894A64|nr:methyl-accepting chemotaxis protein [Kurthia senegalensis]
MTLRKRLLVTLASINVVTILIGIFCIYQLQTINHNYKQLIATDVQQMIHIGDIRKSSAMQSTDIRNYILEPSTENADALDVQSRYLEQSLASLTKQLEKNATTEKEKELVKEATIAIRYEEQIQQYLTSVKSLSESGQKEQAYKMANGKVKDASVSLLNTLDLLRDETEKHMQAIEATENKHAQTASIIIIACVLFVIGLNVISNVILVRRIAKPTRKIAQEVERVANGDLTGEAIATHRSKDEIYTLTVEFNHMKDALYNIIKTSNDSTMTLSGSSEELLSSIDEVNALSERISQRIQAATTAMQSNKSASSEIAIATSESATGISRIAAETGELREFALHTQQISVKGNDTLHDATTQMKVIQKSTETVRDLMEKLTNKSLEIHNFSSAITEITEQTNLLALNAAIEAARAGEAGKGFAVVAEEVRKLSEQSKVSADHIVQLTHEITAETKTVGEAVQYGLSNVTDGVQTIQAASTAFHDINAAITNMTDKVTSISAVTEQISASSEQVAATADQASRASDDTVATMEKINHAVSEQVQTFANINDVAKDLTGQAENLQNHIQNFKL